ncbi:hypothetical protein GA0061078_0287 [Bifidobacterium bohemicum]|uniref:Uncharacterized protein n=1 Tax=Bifidobacterium bohemicum DSM 22767 TaxID=1437606 RepID=A0A086ZJ44_9BIFI|nr:hypothetical protein BBOH_0013 [Bifidobacterium bohemicum DSM 22767]SCB74664.1 hypothetical protein GA0061078_0287 [Bifidobacterium bohemicum]
MLANGPVTRSILTYSTDQTMYIKRMLRQSVAPYTHLSRPPLHNQSSATNVLTKTTHI